MSAAQSQSLSPEQLRAVDQVLQEVCGISLSSGLPGALERAAAEAAQAGALSAAELLARVVARDEAALELLVSRAVVGETSFFRHPEQFEALAELLPALGAAGPLDIWCAGCSSGEEPYSLAMTLCEAGREGDRLLATDISEEALARARLGRYGPWSLRRLRADRRARWFRPAGPDAELDPLLRERVTLRRHNLAADPPPGPFDLVLCRNVVIYFEPAVATRALHRLLGTLRAGGLLVLGPVELPLAASLPAEWIEAGTATLLRRPGGAGLPAGRLTRTALVPTPPPSGRPPAPGLIFLAAREALRRGQLPDAGRLARQSVAAEGGPEPFLLLAQVAEARGEAAEAVALLHQALDIDPALPVALAQLAALLRQQGRPGLSEMARAEALRALAGLPDHQLLRSVERVPAGALRRALSASEALPG